MTRFQEKSIMVELQSSDLDYLSWAHSKPALNPHTIHILTILSKHKSRNIFSGVCLIN